jgi:hypothetical protein
LTAENYRFWKDWPIRPNFLVDTSIPSANTLPEINNMVIIWFELRIVAELPRGWRRQSFHAVGKIQ